jgi:hypothetical protein
MSVTLEDDQHNQEDSDKQELMIKYLKVIAFALCEQQDIDLESLLEDFDER